MTAGGQRVKGKVGRCLLADGLDFITREVGALDLGFEGIVGDLHAGTTRKAGSREPWYPRGTPIRNNRQVTLVSVEELAAIAAAMDLPEVAAEWIGANLVTSGIPGLTGLPPATRLFFANGTVLFIEGGNAPCRIAGRSIAAQYPGRDGLDLLFPVKARRLRGLIASVERPGRIIAGEEFTAHVPAPATWSE